MQDNPTLNALAFKLMFEQAYEQFPRGDEEHPSLVRKIRTRLGHRLIKAGSALAGPSVDHWRPKSA